MLKSIQRIQYSET